MFIAYSSVEISQVDKGWIPDLSPIYYGDNKWGYPKWGLKQKKKIAVKLSLKPGSGPSVLITL